MLFRTQWAQEYERVFTRRQFDSSHPSIVDELVDEQSQKSCHFRSAGPIRQSSSPTMPPLIVGSTPCLRNRAAIVAPPEEGEKLGFRRRSKPQNVNNNTIQIQRPPDPPQSSRVSAPDSTAWIFSKIQSSTSMSRITAFPSRGLLCMPSTKKPYHFSPSLGGSVSRSTSLDKMTALTKNYHPSGRQRVPAK